MKKKRQLNSFAKAKYFAEVDVQLIEEEGGWSPYFSLDDVRKL